MDKREEYLRTMYVEFFHTTQDLLGFVKIYIRKGLKSMALCQLLLAQHAFRMATKLSKRLDKYRDEEEMRVAKDDLSGLQGHLKGAEDIVRDMRV